MNLFFQSCLKLFKGVEGEEKRSGVLVPVPEYPLYSATLGEYNIAKVRNMHGTSRLFDGEAS